MGGIGAVSYSVSAAAFLVLSMILLTSWRGRLQGALLLVACIATVLWSLVAATGAVMKVPPLFVVSLFEVLRDAAWFAFVLKLLAAARGAGGYRARGLVPLAVAGAVISAVAGGVILMDRVDYDAFRGGYASLFSLLILSVTGLVLIEQLYRNTKAERRWAIKFICLGVGAVFAYDLFLYSHSLLFRRIDVSIWAARGVANSLVVPLIAVSAARNPGWSLDVFVSRKMVFHTTTLLVAGAYLLVMAAGGFYIRYYGGSWGGVAQAAFLFGAVLVLFLVLFSGHMRTRLKVFINKHFYSYKYDYREEWLRLIKVLSVDSGDEERFRERLVRGIADIVDSPGGILWLRHEGARYYEPVEHVALPGATVARVGADEPVVPFLSASEWIIDLDEYRASRKGYKGLELPAWITGMDDARLIVPLIAQERLIGFILLARARAPRAFNWEDRDLLKTAGRQAASFLALHGAMRELADARQFEAWNRLSAFVMHDLKSLITQLSLLVDNASRHKSNPRFVEDMIATVENSVAKMNRLMAQLKRDRPVEHTESEVDMVPVLREVISQKAVKEPRPVLEKETSGLKVRGNFERLAMVLGHIVQNAQEATATGGSVTLRLRRDEGDAIVEIEDTGSGMSAEFMQNGLFRPFESTKGDKGMGIGMYESRDYIRSIGGDIEVFSEPGAGTRFCVRIPTVSEAGSNNGQGSDFAA